MTRSLKICRGCHSHPAAFLHEGRIFWQRGIDLCFRCHRAQEDRLRARGLHDNGAAESTQTEPLHSLQESGASFEERILADLAKNIPPLLRCAIILDTPNLTRTTRAMSELAAVPDYRAIMNLAKTRGILTGAVAAVNDGIPNYWVEHIRSAGFTVGFSHARDVDDHVCWQIVRLADAADIIYIGSGDGRFVAISKLLQATGRRVIVVASPDATHKDLLATADEFVPVPVTHRSVPALHARKPILRSEGALRLGGNYAVSKL